MRDDNCIFCKIANGEIPSATIYEDDDFGRSWILARPRGDTRSCFRRSTTRISMPCRTR